MSPPAAAPPMSLGYRPALDGLRALAIGTVIFSHTRYSRLLPGGGVGVDLFFVLSGFLITTVLLDEWERRQTIGVLAFYGRRALRLGPALVALLAGVLLLAFVPAMAESSPRELATFSAYVLTYTANWVLALHTERWPVLLGHLWSLAVEEQFYLVWPVVLLIALRHGVRLRTMVITLLALVAALALWRAIVWHRTHDVHRVYFATDCRASGLLIGSALGMLRGMGIRIPARGSALLAAAGVLVYAWVVTHHDRQTAYPYLLGFKLVELSAVLMLAALGLGDSARVAAPFAWAPLLWAGRRSYAMYLWHVPMLYLAYHMLPGTTLTTTLAGIGLTLGMSELSWRHVEQPALRVKARPEPGCGTLAPRTA